MQGLKKSWIPACSSNKQLSKVLVNSYDLVDRWLGWALAYWANENEKELAWQENLLVPDNRLAIFSSPDMYGKMESICLDPVLHNIKNWNNEMLRMSSMCLSPIDHEKEPIKMHE